MSTDPVWDFPNNFGNGYAYVEGSPISLFDINGQFVSLAAIGSLVGLLAFSLAFVSLTGFMLYSVSINQIGRRADAVNRADVNGWIAKAEKEFNVSGRFIKAVIKAEVEDSLNERVLDRWEYYEAIPFYSLELAFAGLTQLREYEIPDLRKGNSLISNDPTLNALSNRELVLNWEANIYLFAKKIRLLIDEIPGLDSSYVADMKNIGIDLNHTYKYPLEWSSEEADFMGMVQNARYKWTDVFGIGDPFGLKIRRNYEELR